jgi:hypothetical protein
VKDKTQLCVWIKNELFSDLRNLKERLGKTLVRMVEEALTEYRSKNKRRL